MPVPSENSELASHQPVRHTHHRACHPRLSRPLFLILPLDTVPPVPPVAYSDPATCSFMLTSCLYLLLAHRASPEDGEQPSCLHATSFLSSSAVWLAAEPPLGKWVSLCAGETQARVDQSPPYLTAFLVLQELI